MLHFTVMKRERSETTWRDATFTHLVIGTNGDMGDECEKFLKNLAELLAKKDGEEYSDVMMSLKTMLSFQVLRAAVL